MRCTIQKGNEGFSECLNYPGTDDSIRSKIEQTNTLIHKLQQTLNEIRSKSHPSTPNQGVTTTDTETNKSISTNDTNRSTSESDEETAPDRISEIPRHESIVVEVLLDNESNISSQIPSVITKDGPISSNKSQILSDEYNTIPEEVINIPSCHNEGKPDFARPKTRRNSVPDGICSIDRFQNTPKVEMEGAYLSETEFQVLQAKLNTINEQTESDLSSLSEARPFQEEQQALSASCLTEIAFKDFQSGGTASISTQCGNSLKLTTETPVKFEITQKPLNKTTQLVVQLLPTVNIIRGPAPQKLICFSIDPLGKSHLQFKSEAQNVAYFEIESTSLTPPIPSEQKIQNAVRFHEIIAQEVQPEKANAAERDSESVPIILPEFINTEVETADSVCLQENPEIPRNHTAQSEQMLKPSSDLVDISQQLNMIYSEDTKHPLSNDMPNTESNITVERLLSPTVQRPNIDNLRDAKKSSSFNLIDDHQLREMRQQMAKEYKQKSISDPNIHETVHEKHPSTKKRTPPEDDIDIDMIYKSFQLFQNSIDHDPGSLSILSTDLIGTIDQSVYKTYINPSGFHRHNQQAPPNKATKKISTLEKLSSLKFFVPESPSKKQHEEISETAIETHNETPPSTKPSKNTSKLYNIGLYSSKSTQVSEVFPTLKHGKEYPSELSGELLSMIPPNAATPDISYEKISLTISYSTDESSNETSLIASGTREKYSHPEYNSITEQERQMRVVEPMISTEDNQERAKQPKSHAEIPQDVKKFKQLKKKINEEHNIVPSTSHIDMPKSDLSNSVDDISVSIPTFITGLITSNPGDLQKVIPHMRRTVQGAKKRLSMSISKSPMEKIENDNESDTDEKSVYTVLPVRVKDTSDVSLEGDHVSVSVSPLQTGKNGRYEDEENLFCENNYPKIEETLERRFKYNPVNLQRTEHRIDSSNSDTLTSEKTFSDGEIKCHCSVSIGEIHRCISRQVSNHRRPGPFRREEKTRICKKKTYFNNWVTYYLNKNASLVNDSSSTS